MAFLVIVSGAAGSFYLAGAQQSRQAEITLSSTDTEPSSEVSVNGTGFDADSTVSLYVLSATQANLTDSSAFILQEVLNQSTVTSLGQENGNFLDDALDALEDLLGFGGNQDTDMGVAQGNLIVMLEGVPDNGTLSLECDDQELAQGNTSVAIVSLMAPPGTYEECSISISDDNATEIGDFGNLTITPDPDENYEDSLVGSAETDEQGSFESTVTAPRVDGEYAVLAVQDDGIAAVSELSVTSASRELVADNTTGQNITDNAVNETGLPLIAPLEENAAAVENQTEGNQTATSVDASVQVAEENAEPGELLPISGEGFQPNTPVQIFINNVQITNVVTNIEGSFNTVVIVPTTVNAGDVEVVVTTEQTNIVENIIIVEPNEQNQGPATIRFTSVSAADNARALRGAPVTIFDASSGHMVDSDETPMTIELEAGTYSVFYSDFSNFDFQSAEPGTWTDTADGGSGLITVRDGRNATVTAIYSEEPAPPPPSETVNSITLRAVDTDGEPLQGMFVTIYDANTGEKVEQGFTELTIEDLPPGTYPTFFANFANLAFVSASPGSWVQTPFGGAGLVTITDDGEDHDVTVTAVYDRITGTAQEQFNVQAPLDIRGNIFSITSNETRPEGPFVMSGTFALQVDDEDPASASLSVYFMSARADSNENVDLESQRSRDHDAFHIVDFDPRVARPVGLDSYLVSGTADLLLNGDMYSNDERIEVMVRGGEELTPAYVEIEFQGDHRYSAANRLETLYGAVSSGFQ